MSDAGVDAVMKIGGGVLAQQDALARTLDAVADAARGRRLVIVPGGGPFADAVRAVDRAIGLTDDAAHWMAILAMDQYAHLLAARLRGAALVRSAGEIAAALDRGALPVLAPFDWLRAADPLPHAWEVTSDSLAAWLAGALGARRLVLVKPEGSAGRADLVDPWLARTLPPGVALRLLPAGGAATLASALGDELARD